MDKPVDMKLTKDELNDRESPTPLSTSKGTKGPKYPWGLTLRLDDSSLKKLGMDGELPEVGELCQIIGVGRVVSVSQREGPHDSRRDVEIQIERLNLAVDEEDAAFERGAKRGAGRSGY